MNKDHSSPFHSALAFVSLSLVYLSITTEHSSSWESSGKPLRCTKVTLRNHQSLTVRREESHSKRASLHLKSQTEAPKLRIDFCVKLTPSHYVPMRGSANLHLRLTAPRHPLARLEVKLKPGDSPRSRYLDPAFVRNRHDACGKNRY